MVRPCSIESDFTSAAEERVQASFPNVKTKISYTPASADLRVDVVNQFGNSYRSYIPKIELAGLPFSDRVIRIYDEVTNMVRLMERSEPMQSDVWSVRQTSFDISDYNTVWRNGTDPVPAEAATQTLESKRSAANEEYGAW